MKNIQLLIIFLLVISCKKEEVNNTKHLYTEVKENTVAAENEGKGKVTLICNGKRITAEGSCGGVVTMGTLIIAVRDNANAAKIFTIDFNTLVYPVNGKEYLVKPKDYTLNKNPENEVSISFVEGFSNRMNSWDTHATSGTVKFTVNGNQVRCTLKNIRLVPSLIYNAEDLQSEGIVSGELILYKN